jgi:molecular chaperone DnaK
MPQIEVTFDIDANGILSVSAKDKGTGKEQNIRIEASTGLSKEEIEKMKAEAAANADDDRKAKEFADKINAADTLAFQTEKQLNEYGDKIPAEKKAPIEAALSELKEAHKSQDLDRIDAATQALNTAWQAASQEIYQASQQANPDGAAQADPNAAGGQQQNTGNAGDADDVTDVEFEEVDDAK